MLDDKITTVSKFTKFTDLMNSSFSVWETDI